MSTIKSTPENAQTPENALREMSAAMTTFATNNGSRHELDEKLNTVCAEYKHPFGTVSKTKNGACRGTRYNSGQRTAHYDQIKYLACRFCDTTIEKLKL